MLNGNLIRKGNDTYTYDALKGLQQYNAPIRPHTYFMMPLVAAFKFAKTEILSISFTLEIVK